MKRTSCALIAVLAAMPATAVAAESASCSYREESTPATPAAGSRVTVLAATPAAAEEVRRDTVIGVDIEYQIADFAEDTFSLDAQFPTSAYSSMSPGNAADRRYLQSPAGRVHLCVPLEEVYDDQNVRWPLSMQISLHRQAGPGSSTIVARGRELAFKALDIPAGALERQAKAPPAEYEHAFMTTTVYFRSRAATYRACIGRFPATQPVLTKVYRAWESRHRASIDLVAEVLFERNRSMANGRRDVAVHMEDAAIEATRKVFAEMPDAVLEPQCKHLLQDLAPDGDITEDAIGDDIAVLRQYSPSLEAESPR